MKVVTTSVGVPGTLASTLDTLMATLRTATGEQRWRLHIQALQTPEYSLRVYAPDLHCELHHVRMTVDAMKEIREILVNEAKSWESRVRPVLTTTDGDADRKIE